MPRLLLALLGLSTVRGAAPDAGGGYLLRHWGIEEGAPHNSFHELVQAEDGFIWAATDAGLFRFDGIAFQPAAGASLSSAKSTTIRSVIREDSRTLLAVDAKSELIQLRSGMASVLPLPAAPAPAIGVRALARESDEAFWISFLDGEIWRCSPGRTERFPWHGHLTAGALTFARAGSGEILLSRGAGLERYNAGRLHVIPGTEGRKLTLVAGTSGGPWIADAEGLFRWRDGELVPVPAPGWPARFVPELMLEGADGSLWAGFGNYGLVHLTASGATRVEQFRSRINALMEDDQDDLWVATEGNGLNRLRPRRFALLPNSSDMTAEAASSVCEDTAGVMWFAGHSSLRLGRQGVIERLTPEFGWPRTASWICPDSNGHVWIASGRTVYETTAGGRDRPRRMTLPISSQVRALFAARDGALWLGCEAGPLLRVGPHGAEAIGPAQGYSGAKAQVFAEDSAGAIWIGTGEGQLFRVQSNRAEAVDVARFLEGDDIRAIAIDREGWRWVGTDGRGLLAQRGNVSRLLGRNQGLPDVVISQLLEDNFGFLWFGTRRGLFKIRKSELVECALDQRAVVAPVIFGPDDGLSDLSAVGGHQPAAWKTRSGQLWFTTRAGFISTQPGPERGLRFQPRAFLDGASADGMAFADGARLTAATRRFGFRFSAPIFGTPEGVRFRYRLDGLDSDWSEATPLRSASYSRLPGGQYRFVVAVSAEEGGWSPAVAGIGFAVVPRWWETPAMRAGEALACAALLAAAVRYGSQRRLRRRLLVLEQERRLAAERERIARDLHDGIGAGLTHVGMMAEQLAEDGSAEAARLVTRVQSVARDLDAAVWAVSPRHDRLPALCSYVCEYALEFFRDTPIRCRVEVADDLPDWTISPEIRHHLFLSAKEALNNVLKHSGAGQVALGVRRENAEVRLEIKDDGHGFDVAAAGRSDRNGLRNLRGRINEAGARLAVVSSATGTTITIHLSCPSP